MGINKFIVWKDGEVSHIMEIYDNQYYVEEYYWENSDWYDIEFIEKNTKPAKWYHIIKYYLKKLFYKS